MGEINIKSSPVKGTKRALYSETELLLFCCFFQIVITNGIAFTYMLMMVTLSRTTERRLSCIP